MRRYVIVEKHNPYIFMESYLINLISQCKEVHYEKYPKFIFYVKDGDWVFFKETFMDYGGTQIHRRIAFRDDNFWNVVRKVKGNRATHVEATKILNKVLAPHVCIRGYKLVEAVTRSYGEINSYIIEQEKSKKHPVNINFMPLISSLTKSIHQ